jgi:Fe-S oxidoreductase
MADLTFRHYERRPFDRDACTLCGECLHHCPVMHLPRERAAQEMADLLAGGNPPLLRRCTSCLACNLVCPEDCRPANLILDRWHADYLRDGLPARARFFLPHSRPNFRTGILARLPAGEREAVARWRSEVPVREFLYPGCNLITTPYLTFSPLFEGLEIRGSLDYCCGEMLFRMGLYEAVEGVARRLTAWFRRLGAERVHVVCTAGLHMLRHVLPQFGADFDAIEFVPYLEVLLNRLLAGGLGSVRPLDITVTVQDSCHARVVEPGFADLPRQLLAAAGAQVAEAPHNREAQLCCGIGAGFSHAAAYHPAALLLSARATSRDHRRTEAGATCVYCSGCLEMTSVARLVDPNRRPVFHLLELLPLALGSPVAGDRKGALARQFVLGTVRGQFPALLDRRRFWLPELPAEPVGEAW